MVAYLALILSSILSLWSLFCSFLCVFFSFEQEKTDNDPVSKMMMGLTYYEMWYSGIPKEFMKKNLDQIDSQEKSHTEGTSFSDGVGQSEWHNREDLDQIDGQDNSHTVGNSFSNRVGQSEMHNTVESHMADSQYQCDSDSSVNDNREISKKNGLNKDRIVSMDVDAKHKREISHPIIKVEGFSLASDENQGIEDSVSNGGGPTPDILYALLGKIFIFLRLHTCMKTCMHIC